jgi:peptide deformylase
MIRKTVQIGNKVIRAGGHDVTERAIRSQKIKRLIRDMVDTMRHDNLIGIAAPQIGVGLNVFITEVRKTRVRTSVKKDDALRIFINPKILSLSKKQTVLIEGCGSVANAALFGPVRRPAKVTVKAFDADGKLFKLVADGLLAKAIQHEYDHLRGVLCIDKFISTKKIVHRDEYKG